MMANLLSNVLCSVSSGLLVLRIHAPILTPTQNLISVLNLHVVCIIYRLYYH